MDDNPSAAEAMLDAIANFKSRAEAAADAAEKASSVANSESGFAYNAKQNAEEHAKSISQLRGNVEADLAWLITTKKSAEDSTQATITAKTTAEADARAVAEARTVIEKDATTIKAASGQATAALAVIEKAQADGASALHDLTTGAAAASVAKTAAEAAATAAQTLQTQVTELVSKAKVDGAAVAKCESESTSLVASIAKEVASIKATHANVADYEEKLANMAKDFTALHAKIEGLLPNATSAGLASAFRNQKIRFKDPQRNWLIMFVVTIILLLVAALVGSPGFSGTQGSWDSILRHLASRLPFVAPLVWLGIYSGRNYMLALRVEEEYAFKEAVSTAFEGYKREMADISSPGDNTPSPLVILCENVLLALSQRPGRIYEGHHDDITPLAPIARALLDGAQIIGPKKPE